MWINHLQAALQHKPDLNILLCITPWCQSRKIKWSFWKLFAYKNTLTGNALFMYICTYLEQTVEKENFNTHNALLILAPPLCWQSTGRDIKMICRDINVWSVVEKAWTCQKNWWIPQNYAFCIIWQTFADKNTWISR